jgi:BlaI family penicillinase repressor
VGSSQPSISEAELDVLKVLWKRGPGTVREINTLLKRKKRRWAYNTVLTLLTRLKEKRYVTSEKQGVAYVFHPVVSREKLLGQSLTELANRVCDGTASPLVHALVQDGNLTADEIKELRKLIDKLETKEK